MVSKFSLSADILERAPAYHTPLGPVWQVRGEEVFDAERGAAEHFLLRRLPAARAMLQVAPVLAQIARLDNPRMWGPGDWILEDSQVWVAAGMPAGEQLGGVWAPGDEPAAYITRPRLSWAEALELWRPLAEAAARLHHHGVIHGAIAPWNIWVDQERARLVSVDAGCWVGDDLQGARERHGALAHFIAPELALAPDERRASISADIYGLARVLLALTLPAEQAAAGRPSFTGLPAYAIPALNAALSIDPAARPQRVADLVAASAPQAFFQAPADDPESAASDPAASLVAKGAQTASILFARVSQVERIEHPKMGDGIKFYLNHKDEQIGAFFYQKQAPEVFESVKWAWEGCELNLLDARVVENSAGERFLTGHPQTLPVLEPHMPISVSDVLKSEGCTSRFMVDQRESGGSSRPLVLGNLVHGLMDDLAGAEEVDFDSAYQARVDALGIDLLAAGLRDSDLGELYSDARQHFGNIERFTAWRTSDTDRMGWSGRLIEVTRFSSIYGIEGRVDLVSQDPREGLQIIELKTGRAWDGHQSQLRFYWFLWEGLAQRADLEISGKILYSKVGRMQPAPMVDIERERRILRARNELLASLRQYIDPNYAYHSPYYMQFPRACRSSACNFRRERCARQTEVLGLGDASSEDAPFLRARGRLWHQHFTRLIEMERWAATEKLGALLHPGRLAERKQNYSAIDNLQVIAADPKLKYIEFLKPSSGPEGAPIFYPGDYVVAHRGDFNAGHILRGRIVACEHRPGEGVRITLGAQAVPGLEQVDAAGWIVDKLPARLGFRQAHRAIYGALKREDLARHTVLFSPGTQAAAQLMEPAEVELDLDAATSSLNPSQQDALRRAIGAPAGALIQGPPGTGKTTVIAHAVRELVARGKKVLLSAFTNTAVDTILQKLLEIGVHEFLRVGDAAKSGDLVRALKARGLKEERFFSDDMARNMPSLDILAEDLLGANILASTTHRAASSALFDFLREQRGAVPFDVAIVDEAAQTTEPMTLAAINLGARFILVGDHRQLPPIVENEQAHSNFVEGALFDAAYTPGEAAALGDIGCGGLDRSLFERLVGQLPHIMLEEQYRMHDKIMAFSNEAFYAGKLRAHASIAERKWAGFGDKPTHIAKKSSGLDENALNAVLTADHSLVFVDVDRAPSAEQDAAHIRKPGDPRGLDGARANLAEARALVDAVAAILGERAAEPEAAAAQEIEEMTGALAASIGVISPFRAQVQLIRALLAERLGARADAIDVDTVERFQGSERDVILVSLVKTERAGDFLADARRLNVTLTRARQKLVIFGRRRALELNGLFRALIEQPETHLISWSER